MGIQNLKKEDIKSFEDVCKVWGIDPDKTIPDFSMFPENQRNAMIAHAKLVLIAKTLNTIENDGQPWTPDWNNGKWDKYYPWFKMGSASGVGFSYNGCDYWYSTSTVGSRLCFKSWELAEYAGETFEDLYKAYFVL